MQEMKTAPKNVTLKYESASARITIQSKEMSMLSHVFSKDRQKGHASGLMRTVTEYADAHGITLWLQVGRYHYSDSISLSNSQLVEFYQKYGFERFQDDKSSAPFMIRKALLKGEAS